MKKWEEIPEVMKCPEVRKYYDLLQKKKAALVAKRCFDVIMSVFLIVLLLPVLLIIGIAVKATSPGEAVFKQVRVTTYGKRFRIYKFRTMVAGAPQKGAAVTVNGDARVTKIGTFLRKVRLDELPQLFNIVKGDMSFVGTRPEVERYVDAYSDEMYATLLLPAGVTSPASIEYKDEERLLSQGNDVDATYIQEILPAKMEYNLRYLEEFSFWGDIRILFQTVVAVLR
nr:sugar transferase [Eubacterium sp.]